MTTKYAYAVLLIVSLTALIGARPTMRGYPVGKVVEVNREMGVVSADLGRADGVMKGMRFSVVDKKGGEAAVIAAGDVYGDLFWSVGIPAGEVRKLKPGMEVRWLLTPEVIALVGAVKKDTVEGYREFVKRFPGSGFLPEIIRDMPEERLRALSPEYYEAWKSYTRYSFEEFINKHPDSGFAQAAKAELKSIEEFEAEGERIRKERERRAEAAEAERARQQAVEEKIRERQEQAARREALGKLVNNSAAPVRFVFDPPDQQAPVVVPANGYTDLRHVTGTFTYKVFAVEEEADAPAFRDLGLEDGTEQGPAPLKEGEADIEFDFWEIEYP